MHLFIRVFPSEYFLQSISFRVFPSEYFLQSISFRAFSLLNTHGFQINPGLFMSIRILLESPFAHPNCSLARQ
jgi:hypothetical protein